MLVPEFVHLILLWIFEYVGVNMTCRLSFYVDLFQPLRLFMADGKPCCLLFGSRWPGVMMLVVEFVSESLFLYFDHD